MQFVLKLEGISANERVYTVSPCFRSTVSNKQEKQKTTIDLLVATALPHLLEYIDAQQIVAYTLPAYTPST